MVNTRLDYVNYHRERITVLNLDKIIISEFSTANPTIIIYDLI